MSDSLQRHESQHARPPCPSPTPGVHSNSLPWSRWCHPAISSSVIPFFSCPQSLPASESFPMSQLFARGGQSIGVSALASVLPMNTQDWSPLGWTGWISLQSKGLSRVFSSTTVHKHQFVGAQLSLWSSSHICTWLLVKTSLVAQTVKSLAYNAGDLGLIPGLRRSSGEGNGNPLQYSRLENPMDKGAWWATVHWVAKSRTRLNDLTFTFTGKNIPWLYGSLQSYVSDL